MPVNPNHAICIICFEKLFGHVDEEEQEQEISIWKGCGHAFHTACVTQIPGVIPPARPAAQPAAAQAGAGFNFFGGLPAGPIPVRPLQPIDAFGRVLEPAAVADAGGLFGPFARRLVGLAPVVGLPRARCPRCPICNHVGKECLDYLCRRNESCNPVNKLHLSEGDEDGEEGAAGPGGAVGALPAEIKINNRIVQTIDLSGLAVKIGLEIDELKDKLKAECERAAEGGGGVPDDSVVIHGGDLVQAWGRLNELIERIAKHSSSKFFQGKHDELLRKIDTFANEQAYKTISKGLSVDLAAQRKTSVDHLNTINKLRVDLATHQSELIAAQTHASKLGEEVALANQNARNLCKEEIDAMKKHLEMSLKAAEKKVEQSKKEVADVKKSCADEVLKAKQAIEGQMHRMVEDAKRKLRREADEWKERLEVEKRGEMSKLEKERKSFVVGKMMQRQREHLLRKQFAKQQQKALHINSILAQIIEVKSNAEAKANLIDLADGTDDAQPNTQNPIIPITDEEALLNAQNIAQALLTKTKTNTTAPATPPSTPTKHPKNGQPADSLSFRPAPRFAPYAKQMSKRTGKTTIQEKEGPKQGKNLHERHRLAEKSKAFLAAGVPRT